MKKLKVILVLILIIGLTIFATGCPGTSTTTASVSSKGSMVTTHTSTPTSTAPSSRSTTTLTPTEKPAIYLYPESEMLVHVTLKYNGRLTCTYPAYPADGWQVTAYPDGWLINRADGREYSYLYWEGLTDVPYDFNQGFVVAGGDTVPFLQEKLAYLGLTPREYNEFIVFWLPRMQDNPYNLITFQGKAYTDSAELIIIPKPDSLLRVFMAYKPLQERIEIEPQNLSGFERSGFTVVEWGGTCVE